MGRTIRNLGFATVSDGIPINYIIGEYLPGTNQISGKHIKNGTLEEANEELQTYKTDFPDKDWRIFQLIQVLQ